MAGGTEPKGLTDAQAVLSQMATASITLRDAITKALPVAPTQLMTVQIPGLTLDPNRAVIITGEAENTSFKPLSVREHESRLVDNMVPVAKLMMGRTGKSVARSYLSALDTLVPVEASVSGSIALNKDNEKIPEHFKTIRNRYHNAMTFLESADERSGMSKLSVYVAKQEKWNQAVEQYALAQQRQQDIISREGLKPERQRERYLEWLQVSARDYKAMIQARYMDWVVHGHKFEVEFNFAVVDISSGMKRIESSKEAMRNLTIIGIDGATEYATVNLTPEDWGYQMKAKMESWATSNKRKGPSVLDLRAEIKRLSKILISHQAMIDAMNDTNGYMPVLASGGGAAADAKYRQAMKEMYLAQDKVNQKLLDNAEVTTSSAGVMAAQVDADSLKGDTGSAAVADARKKKTVNDTEVAAERKVADDAAKKAQEAAKAWNEENLEANKVANRITSTEMRNTIRLQLGHKVGEIKQEISTLNEQLKKKLSEVGGAEPNMPAIMDDNKTVEPMQLKADPTLTATATEKPSKWTHISAKVSRSQSTAVSVSKESATGFSAKVSAGLWNVSGGASHSSASTESSVDMSSLDVEITMECMLVEIQRPWLHAELFSDPELDVVHGFDLSPGPEELYKSVEAHKPVEDKYNHFCSYSTAFVVAANVELEFTGNTSHLESKLESSRTEANLSVGWGPFSFGGSHSSSKSSAKTSAEATATGMRISLQAPQIIAWVSELLPALPNNHKGNSKMSGLLLDAPSQANVPKAAETSASPAPVTTGNAAPGIVGT